MRSLFKYVNESVLKKKNPIFEVGEEGGGDGRCRKPSTKMREMCVFGVPHLAVLRHLVSSDASCEMRKKIIDPSSEKKFHGVRQRLWGKWVAEVQNLAR
ncbi:hypothetical protein JHK87_042714 [Glycine soja]|nr:hypothetical protein JHK87_042714 [Glycine soja]